MKKSKELEKFISMMFLIGEKPGVFGMSSSDDIYHFLQGFFYASNDEIKDFISDFKSYVNKHFVKTYFPDRSDFELDWKNWIRFTSSTNFESVKWFDKLFKGYVESLE